MKSLCPVKLSRTLTFKKSTTFSISISSNLKILKK